MTLISISTASSLPIYDQVVRQLSFSIAAGALAAGEFVPSVRELAKELAINPNTVARAYRELQTAKILTSVRGNGLAVSTGAVERCRALRRKLLRQRLREVFREAEQSRIERRELLEMIDEELAELTHPK
jgi:GntR family transcriptional regulator